MARRVLMAEVSGGRVQGTPMLGWMDMVSVFLGLHSCALVTCALVTYHLDSREKWDDNT